MLWYYRVTLKEGVSYYDRAVSKYGPPNAQCFKTFIWNKGDEYMIYERSPWENRSDKIQFINMRPWLEGDQKRKDG